MSTEDTLDTDAPLSPKALQRKRNFTMLEWLLAMAKATVTVLMFIFIFTFPPLVLILLPVAIIINVIRIAINGRILFSSPTLERTMMILSIMGWVALSSLVLLNPAAAPLVGAAIGIFIAGMEIFKIIVTVVNVTNTIKNAKGAEKAQLKQTALELTGLTIKFSLSLIVVGLAIGGIFFPPLLYIAVALATASVVVYQIYQFITQAKATTPSVGRPTAKVVSEMMHEHEIINKNVRELKDLTADIRTILRAHRESLTTLHETQQANKEVSVKRAAVIEKIQTEQQSMHDELSSVEQELTTIETSFATQAKQARPDIEQVTQQLTKLKNTISRMKDSVSVMHGLSRDKSFLGSIEPTPGEGEDEEPSPSLDKR